MNVRHTFLPKLAIVVTLIVSYFFTWDLTKRHAQHLTMNSESNLRVVNSAGSPAPLIVYCDEYWADKPNGVATRRYYFWLFGPMIPSVLEKETKLVLLLAISAIVICTLGFAWRTNQIQISGVALSIILFLVAMLVLLLLPAVQ